MNKILKQFSQTSISLNNNQNYNFATKLSASSTKKTKDSAGRRLGVKKLGNAEVFPMDILVRQRGFKWHPGKNTYFGRDHTIHAKTEGIVTFTKDPWRQRKKIFVNVEPQELPSRKKYQTAPPPPYCYHPELFPELAKSNPQPTNLKITQKQPKEVKPKSIGMKAQNNNNQNIVHIPQEYMVREQEEILDTSVQFTNYIQQIEEAYLDLPPQLEDIQELEQEQQQK